MTVKTRLRHVAQGGLEATGLRDQARFARAFASMVLDGSARSELATGRQLHTPSDIPPGWLLYLTQGSLSRRTYHESGRQAMGYIQQLLDEAGLVPDGSTDILDFGCGVGRILRWWDPPVRPRGCDYNTKLVTWCQQHLAGAEVSMNALAPPISFDDDSFDFLYAQSVLTHLPPDLQEAWMVEWQRIVRPGGLILVTTHGPHHLFNDDRRRLPSLEAAGNLTLTPERAGDNLCAVFNTHDDMVRRVGRHLELAHFEIWAMPGSNQDVYLFRAP